MLIYRGIPLLPSLDDGRRFCPYVSAASLCAPGSEIRLHYGTAEKITRRTGTLEFRGVQADLGEAAAWRNTFWALSDSMCSEATPWVNGAYLPDHAALQTYRVLAPMAYAKIKNIIERNVTSGLI
ncbi:4-hydroxyphenylacetate 3-hydroxylase C-terminal domain-containing protein [Escherichia coli]